ncbi:hypothetical protein B0H17DRAFT_1152830 [Mycena rosella]|uniref:Uncharacterized protein n=1 Tax=Mycena rosella TaxID=1033263 RepID=A0AAD7FCE8_MYCRO|nr:hypothetical protein B0H17DRAFT_1152830 [Mycena rosella]
MTEVHVHRDTLDRGPVMTTPAGFFEDGNIIFPDLQAIFNATNPWAGEDEGEILKTAQGGEAQEEGCWGSRIPSNVNGRVGVVARYMSICRPELGHLTSVTNHTDEHSQIEHDEHNRGIFDVSSGWLCIKATWQTCIPELNRFWFTASSVPNREQLCTLDSARGQGT